MQENKSLRRYKDAIAIVTGAASGIGRALAEELAHRGAHVVLADRQIELAEEVADKIRRQEGKAVSGELNVTDFQATRQLIEQTAQQHGRLDYLFNNAGISVGGEALLHQIEDWNLLLDVNVHGVVHGIVAAYPLMVEQGFGHIINTASMAGLMPTPGIVSYAASKHFVVGLSISLRGEGALSGVRVSALCPGVIRTPILEDCGKYGRMLRKIPRELQQKNWAKLRPMEPALFARKTLEAVAKNRAIIIFPKWWKLYWWLYRLAPCGAIRHGTKGFAGYKKELEAHLEAEGGDVALPEQAENL